MIPHPSRRYWHEWFLLGAVLLVLGAMLGGWLYAEHEQITSLERDRLQVQARVIDENLGRQLEGVNDALVAIRDDVPQWQDRNLWPAAARQLRTLGNAMVGVRTLVILDAAGSVLASNRDELIGRNFSDRAYFKAPHEHMDAASLYVSPPFKTVLNVVVVSLARVIVGPKGEFAGVVAATLDREYFDVLLRSVLYAPDMRAVLVHWDGAPFAIVPPFESLVGVDLAKPGSFFSRHRERGQMASLITGTSTATGLARMLASRTIAHAKLAVDKPLVIQVGRALSAIYAPWRKQALAYAMFYALTALASTLGLYFMQRRRRSFDRMALMHENERSDSAERLELALGGADLGLWDWHVPSGKVIFDERWCSMLGYALGEIEPHVASWQNMVHPDDWPSIRAALDPHLQGRSTAYESEHRMRHKDGHWVWILDRGKVMERDAAGAPLRVVGTHMNITGRRQAQDALRESEKSLREVQEVGRIGSYAWDIPGDIWRSSPMLDTIFGIGPEFPRTAAGWAQLIHPDDRGDMAAYLRDAMSTKGRFDKQYRIVRASDGAERWAWGLGKFEYGADGAPLRMVGTIQDVTETRRKEGEYRSIIQATTDGFWIADAAGRILDTNESMCRILGYSREELLRMNIADIDVDETAEQVAIRLRDTMRTGGARFQARCRRKDGTAIDAEVNVLYVPALGERFIAFTRDVTELKRAEARQDQLEAQLRESQKMEALGTLAGGVAHDFNNIVAAIMGNAELALQDVGPGHAALESLEEIRKASGRAKNLVQQILAFGRRHLIERRVIPLAPVVEDSARMLRAALPAGVKLSVECAPDAPAVLADASQIEQVLLNLCTNAWQAMQGQAGPAAIELRLLAHLADGTPYAGPERRSRSGRVALRPGSYACLVVRDTGPGMDQATRSRIFEPFFTTKAVGKGTGLGLAVVHGIVMDHGASIAVQSAPGEGATFRIYFPAAEQAAEPVRGLQPEPGAVRAQGSGAAPVLAGRGTSILYLDDDEAIVFLMTRLLERQGYRVSGHTDPQAALAAVRAQPDAYDLVVTDYNMPGLSGLEVARALREIRAGLPVALASGYITEELRAEAPAAGVIELIYKPNTVDELCAVVERMAKQVRA